MSEYFRGGWNRKQDQYTLKAAKLENWRSTRNDALMTTHSHHAEFKWCSIHSVEKDSKQGIYLKFPSTMVKKKGKKIHPKLLLISWLPRILVNPCFNIRALRTYFGILGKPTLLNHLTSEVILAPFYLLPKLFPIPSP